MAMAMIEWARFYISQGFNVLPVKKNSKAPRLKGWERYTKKRVTDGEVNKWFGNSSAGIGVVTGRISGIVVVDIDSVAGLEALKKMLTADEMDTFSVVTGRGGQHLYYRYPISAERVPNRVGLVTGVDIRADGGFAVLPPTVHTNGRKYGVQSYGSIKELPKALHKLIIRGKAKKKVDWDNDHITEGSRNDELTRRAGKLFAAGMKVPEVKAVLHYWNTEHVDPPLSVDEVNTIVESIGKRNMSNNSKFSPRVVADEVMDNMTIVKISGVLYVYRDGVYRYGEDSIAAYIQGLLGDMTTNNKIKESIDFIRRSLEDTEVVYNESVINCANGLYNRRTGKLTPHTPEFVSLSQLPVAYNPKAKGTVFKEYLKSTLPESLHTTILQVVGYCCTASTKYEKAFMLTGTGANGKSVFLEMLTALIGKQNISNVSLQELEDNRFKKAELFGKLVNIFPDLPSYSMKSASTFKALVSGDRIGAERKFKDPFSFSNVAKLVFSANTIPISRDKSRAFIRRWVIIPFERTFDRGTADRNLKAKLVLRDELEYLLKKAIDSLAVLDADNGFYESDKTRTALDEFEKNNNSVARFVDDEAVVDPTRSVEKTTLYRAYRFWAGSCGIRPVSVSVFKTELLNKIPDITEYRPTSTSPRRWRGIGLPV